MQKNTPNIWKLIELSSIKVDVGTTQTIKKDQKTEDEKKKDLKKLKRWVRIVDALSLTVWSYVVCKLFILDLDVQLVAMLGSNFSWILWFKSVFFLTIVVLISVFLWKWKTLAAMIYIVFFPIIVVGWKIPRLLYKRKNWLTVVAAINGVGSLIKNFRYNLIAKSLGLISATFILFTGIDWLIIPSAAVILLLLSWASVRTVRLAFRQDWFLNFHQRIIIKVVDSNFVSSFTSISPEIKKGELKKLDAGQLSALVTGISTSMIINKGLYFWAYQLQKYKRSGIEISFNIVSFLWLLFGTVISFWLINTAIYNVAPAQFSFTSGESSLSIFVYSMSTLFFNEGAGIVPVGDVALVSRIAAGIFGTVFIFTILVNSISTFRRSKNNQALDDIVSSLKKRASKQSEGFEKEYSLTVDEARLKLEQLGTGLHALVRIISSAIPTDFMNDREEITKKK